MKEELAAIIDKIEERKIRIAKERDELRKIYDRLSDLLEPFTAGVEGLDNGIIEIRNAIDSISEVV
jgi:hypothetical protein